MMFDELLLGFDIRERRDGLGNLWDPRRRSAYLLRVDTPEPLSVDTSVWPSIFDTGQGIGFSRSERERLHLTGISIPTYIGPNAGLWDDAGNMVEYLNEQKTENVSGVVIAISWVSDSGFSDEGEFGPYLAHSAPTVIDPSWERLGYDVGDGSLVSGLSNCGYLPEEVEYLRAQWRSTLNESHLFGNLLSAFQFRDLTNERVPSHAPFFVYGLYLIESLD